MSFWNSIVTGVIIAVIASFMFSAFSWLKKHSLRRKYANAPREWSDVMSELGDKSYWQAIMDSQNNPFSHIDNTSAIASYISSLFWRSFDTNRKILREKMPDIEDNIDIMAAIITIGEMQLTYLHKIMYNIAPHQTETPSPGFMNEDI